MDEMDAKTQTIKTIQESITVSQTDAAALLGTTTKTLRNWESFNPELRAVRSSKTTARYTLASVAAFSRRFKRPLRMSVVNKLKWPPHLLMGFHTQMPRLSLEPVGLDPASTDDATLATLQVVEQLRMVADGRYQTLPGNLRAAIRNGFEGSPSTLFAVAAILSELGERVSD